MFNRRKQTAWTADEIATLRRLWSEGVNAKRIAKTLRNGRTKNAVIGKAHRLDLPEHAKALKGNRWPPKPRPVPPGPKPRGPNQMLAMEYGEADIEDLDRQVQQTGRL